MDLMLKRWIFAALALLLLIAGTTCKAQDAEPAPATGELAAYTDEAMSALLRGERKAAALQYSRLGETVDARETTDAETIEAVLAALRALRIGESVEERATDSDDLFLFTLDDGTTCSVAFEAHRLNTGDARYIVENGGALWKLAASILEPEA